MKADFFSTRPRHATGPAAANHEPSAQLRSCIALFEQRRWQDCISSLHVYLNEHPNSAGGYYYRAAARFAMEDVFRAHEDVTIALLLDPGSVDARLLRAQIYICGNNILGALEETTAAIHYQPNNADAYFFRAQLKSLPAVKQFGLASEDVQRALALRPDSPAILTLEGDLHVVQKRMLSAIESYEHALSALDASEQANTEMATHLRQRILVCQMHIGNVPMPADSEKDHVHHGPSHTQPSDNTEDDAIAGPWMGEARSLVNYRTRYVVEAVIERQPDSGMYTCTFYWKDEHGGHCTETAVCMVDGSTVTIHGLGIHSVVNRFPDENIRYTTARYEMTLEEQGRRMQGTGYLGDDEGCVVSLWRKGTE
jgi:hypothetical protein